MMIWYGGSRKGGEHILMSDFRQSIWMPYTDCWVCLQVLGITSGRLNEIGNEGSGDNEAGYNE